MVFNPPKEVDSLTTQPTFDNLVDNQVDKPQQVLVIDLHVETANPYVDIRSTQSRQVASKSDQFFLQCYWNFHILDSYQMRVKALWL